LVGASTPTLREAELMRLLDIDTVEELTDFLNSPSELPPLTQEQLDAQWIALHNEDQQE
jgi:hypothetical protein